MSSGCPFGGAKPPEPLRDLNAAPAAAAARPVPRLPTGKARVRLLYEEYVHLPALRAVWTSPITESPLLEPSFAAGFHGIELGLLLLAQFLEDRRDYVAKRPRVERVADDIAVQCKLLAEVVDGELEEEGIATSRLSLTQEFPFPANPPTADAPSWSPGLARLEAAVRAALPGTTLAERNSIVKTVLNLTGTAFGSFQRWSVGLGVEPQLNSLREAVGLPPLPFAHVRWLDYGALVRPGAAEATLTGETYAFHEDFFFRTVHLGTECWALVALARLRQAAELAGAGAWAVATARVLQAAKILDYLGSHVLLLTSMNLRDYLRLKVELEGTSGEGSAQVKAFRPAVAALLAPLAAALLPAGDKGSQELALGHALMEVYEFPDRPAAPAAASNRELYNYAKALEEAESGLLGGFFFRHYQLAANVIGSDARGTMQRAVAGLRATYEAPVFPLLDRVRSGLGAKADAELAALKGRMMQDIIEAYLRRNEGAAEGKYGAPKPAPPVPSLPAPLTPLSRLYSWEGVPAGVREEAARHAAALGLPPGGGLPFLDHAWGRVPPAALHAALAEVEALYSLGNPAWEALFGGIMPEATGHVLRVLGVPQGAAADVTVHFGHNAHELVTRLLSQLLMRQGDDGGRRPLRLLTSDAEFYSFTRQVNVWVAEGAVEATAVAADPAETFAGRCLEAAAAAAAAGAPFSAAYLSQVTSLTQQTLLPDLAAFVPGLTAALDQAGPLGPLLVVDGYHSFAAAPAPLGAEAAALGCCFLGGVVKHAGAGANCAFVTVPRRVAARLRPVLTGWLADPSVLALGAPGVKLGDPVGYDPGLALQGGTPALFLPLLTFNHAQRAAAAAGVGPGEVAAHVAGLQHAFLAGLAAAAPAAAPEGPRAVSLATLLPPKDAGEGAWRSHTLVFDAGSGQAAATAVAAARRRGVLIDARGRFVRVGFGPNHTRADVDTLLAAVRGGE